MIEWIYSAQTSLHQLLLGQVDTLKNGLQLDLVLVLLAMCFGYGLFHAAGPGHGKLVLGSYALGSRAPIGKLVSLSFTSSMAQGLVAIIIIGALVTVGGLLPRQTETTVDWVERLSYLALAGIGLWMIYQAVRQWVSKKHQCNHTHQHDHIVHASIISSVALRPCTGAILILVLCQSIGVFWLGVGGVVLMSLGTALGVLTVTLLALSGRAVLWKSTVINQQLANRIMALIRLSVGVFLIYIAWLLVMASLAPKHPLGF